MSQAAVPPIGDRIRAERTRRGLTVRGLARDIGVSASLISQIENDKSQPSVSTLYAITTALGITIEELFDEPGAGTQERTSDSAASVATFPAAVPAVVSAAAAAATESATIPARAGADGQGAAHRLVVPGRLRAVGPIVTPDQREVLTLDSGVTWERLGQVANTHVDFLLITYQPGGTSSSSGELMRHSGTEYGYLLNGSLVLTLGFEEHRLRPGDAVSFDSTTPHGYRNDGLEPAVGVWFVLERT